MTFSDPEPGIEQHFTLSRDCETLDQALSWVVQQVDTRFAGADAINLAINTVLLFDDETDDCERAWQATVTGHLSGEPLDVKEPATR